MICVLFPYLNSIYRYFAGFSLRTDGIGVLNYSLDVEDKNCVKILLGKDGRNLRILKESVRASLIKHFQRDFLVHILVKVRQNGMLAENLKNETIFDKDDGLREAQQSVQSYKAKRLQTLARLQHYLSS